MKQNVFDWIRVTKADLNENYQIDESETENCSVVSDILRPHGLYNPWNSLDQNAEVGTHSLLQGIFPTQGSNPSVPHYRRVLYQLSHQWRPISRAESKSLPNTLEILSDTKHLFRYLWLINYHRVYSFSLISLQCFSLTVSNLIPTNYNSLTYLFNPSNLIKSSNTLVIF